jgi:GNAT superfamily N-acetyltransferase
MSPFAVRDAAQSDLPTALRLLRAQLDEHAIAIDDARLESALGAVIAQPALGRVVLAVEGDRPVGLAALSFTWTLEHGGKVAWLEELYVVPERRCQGVGTVLLRAALAAAEAEGCRAVDLEIDRDHARASHLYAREGFTRLPRERWTRHRREAGSWR